MSSTTRRVGRAKATVVALCLGGSLALTGAIAAQAAQTTVNGAGTTSVDSSSTSSSSSSTSSSTSTDDSSGSTDSGSTDSGSTDSGVSTSSGDSSHATTQGS